MKLIFGCPSYGPMEPEAVISQRTAIMHAAGHGHTWIGDCSPNRVAWTAARNEVVKNALETEADYICWADSDVILPPFAFTALLKSGLDFVTGIYFQRHSPHWPLIAHYQPERESFAWFTDWPENVIAPIDGCGFGCVITSTKMLRALPLPWFHYEKFSEDFDFCRKAAKSGFKLFVHTGVICGHLADPVPVGVDDFKKAWAEEAGKTNKEICNAV
jgi:hypothetical protein